MALGQPLMEGFRRRPANRQTIMQLLRHPGGSCCVVIISLTLLFLLLRPVLLPVFRLHPRERHVTNAVAHFRTTAAIEMPGHTSPPNANNMNSVGGKADQEAAKSADNSLDADASSALEQVILPKSWGSCHRYGRQNHLCRIKNVLYEGGSLLSHWQAGTALPFFVDDLDDIDLINSTYTIPGPCAEYTAFQPGCRDNTVLLQALSAEKHHQMCADAILFPDPIVFVYRNFVNVGHWLYDQLAPFYLTLQEFGLTGVPVQILFLDEDRYAQHHAKPDQVAQREVVWSQIAGRDVQRWWPNINASFCAPWAILGTTENLLARPDTYLALPEVLTNRARYEGFADWVLSKFAVTRQHQLDSSNPVITIETRAGSVTRRVLNEHEVLAVAETYSSRAALASFTGMSMHDQLTLLARSDVYIAVHGAALGWAAFLPPWAVVVELKPYAYNVPMDFFYGYCTWARLFSRSHLSWHNRNASASIADDNAPERWYVKDFHTSIDADNASWIIESAVNLTRMPLQARELNECIDLNKPATFEEFGEPIGFEPFEPIVLNLTAADSAEGNMTLVESTDSH